MISFKWRHFQKEIILSVGNNLLKKILVSEFKMKPSLALVTNLYYQANGRDYYKEDLYLSEKLREYFRVMLIHIDDLDAIAENVDAILIRNTGPKADHDECLQKIMSMPHWPVYNDLRGQGDLKGKQHLLDLYRQGYPVIPTVSNVDELNKLGSTSSYIIKPIAGCDSHGLQILNKEELIALKLSGVVIQPIISFLYEVSFYFINDTFQYALYAPDPSKRWELKNYSPDKNDLTFAEQFIHWNTCTRGIQRIDACRDAEGKLYLMELEDYNPFLSLSLLDDLKESKFLKKLQQDIVSFPRNQTI